MAWLFLRLLGSILFLPANNRSARRRRRRGCGALDMAGWNRLRERRQVVCAHFGSGLITRGELDQSRFAKGRPEEANAERHTEYYASRNLNDWIAWRGGQS